jgi:uncharacterized metal-binding protein YceD (DUF177 family)
MNHPVNQEPETPPLIRKLRVSEIADNVGATLSATEAERAAIAGLLDLVGLESLNFDYRLRRGGGGRVHLSGRLTADATQTCVVTLEPVPAPIDVPVEVEFWPERLIADLEKKAADPSHTGLIDWPEAIADDTIDLGPVVYESFATALDPYPKKEGASFQWSQDGSEQEAQEARESGPFAALKQLKKP